MGRSGLFTMMIDTYNRPSLLRAAVSAALRQTYDHVELILVNNGATPETIDYLHEVAASDPRVKLVHFTENQYSWDDPTKMLDACLNAALKVATGEYVWYQADDDLIADDYAEKMVALFRGRPECTTAAGLPVSIDIHGQVIEGPRVSNLRPRYMPGHELALGVVRGEHRLFSAPGTIFTIKREVLVRSGGYHRALELSHLYGIVPFGVTGFDETALFYWRRHEGQINRRLAAEGWVGLRESLSLLRDWEIERRWQEFGAAIAREAVDSVERQLCATAAKWCVANACCLRLKGAFRIFHDAWRHPKFWQQLPGSIRQWSGHVVTRCRNIAIAVSLRLSGVRRTTSVAKSHE